MSKKIVLGIMLSCIFMVALFAVENLKIGIKAPNFKVVSGDDKELNSKMTNGKVVVIFYETKDLIEKNRKLKTELNNFYEKQSDSVKNSIVKLPVIDCSGAFRPFIGIWKSSLIDNSKIEGMTIYGDWDSSMLSDYKMKKDECNVVILDKKGVIRYFAFGTIDDKGIKEIKVLLTKYALIK